MRFAGFDLAILGFGHGKARGAGLGKRVVVALIERKFLVFQMQDRAHGTVEQPAVVAHDEHGVGVFCQIALKPERAFKVEVVCRLIEQQKVWLRKQNRRQSHPHPPTTGEGGAGLVHLFGREAKAPQDGGGARLSAPSVDIGQACLHFGNAGRIGAFVCQKGGALGIGGQHGVEQRHLVAGHFLCHATDARAARQAERAGVERQLATDDAKERCLARAVAAHKANFVACRNGDGGIFNEKAARDGVGYVFKLEHGSALAEALAPCQSRSACEC